MRGVWESADAFFNRLDARNDGAFVRLHKLDRAMQDFVGREPGHALTSAVGAFVEVTDSQWKDDRHYRIREEGFEAESQRRAERLRTSFRPARLKKRCFSHVGPRPVPVDLVLRAARLGIYVSVL